MLHPFSIGLDSIVNTDPAALAGMLVYVRTMDIMDLSGNVLETPPSSDSDRLFNDEVWRSRDFSHLANVLGKSF